MKLCTVVMAAGVVAAVACAGELSGDAAVVGRFRQFERDIPCLYLLNGLNLSKTQAGELSKLVGQAAAAEDRFAKESQRVIARSEKDLTRELSQVARDAARGRDVSGEGTSMRGSRVGESRRQIAVLRRERDEVVDKCADKAYALLTASQCRIFDTFKPCFIPANDFRNPERVGQVAGDTTRIEEGLAMLRRVPPGERASVAIDRALDKLVPHVLYERHQDYTPEREAALRKQLRPRLESAAQQARALSDSDFELEKARIAAAIVPPDDDRARTAGADRWKVRAYLLNAGVVDVLRDRAAGAATNRAEVCRLPEALRLQTETRQAVTAAATLKGLNLTDSQIGSLLPVVRKAVKARDDLDNEAETAMSAALESYGRLRGELAVGQPEGPTEGVAGGYHQRVRMLWERELVRRLSPFEKEMDQVLTASQVSYLMQDRAEWQDLPEDQAAALRQLARDEVELSMDRARRFLSSVRRMSAPEYEKDRLAVCRDFVTACVPATGAGSVDPGAEAVRIAAVLDVARKLDTAEYSRQRDSLAADVCPKIAGARPTAYTPKFADGEPVPRLWSSTGILFSEPACEILANMAR